MVGIEMIPGGYETTLELPCGPQPLESRIAALQYQTDVTD